MPVAVVVGSQTKEQEITLRTVIAVLEGDIFHGAEAAHVGYRSTVDVRGNRHVEVVGE